MEFDDEANGDRDIRKNGQTRLFHLNYRASCLIWIRGFLASRHRSLRHMGIQYKIERNNYGSGENNGNYKRGSEPMKSKTLAFAALLLVTAFLLVQAIAPQTALAASTWTDSRGPGNGSASALAYDSVHNIIYRGTSSHGVLKYDGTSWTDTGGGVSSYRIYSLAYDSGHNLLYAWTSDYGVWKYDGATWTNTG